MWNAKFESWVALQLGPAVAQRYSSLVKALPMVNNYQPVQGYVVTDVKFASVDDFEQKVYNYFFANEQMQQKVFAVVSEFQVVG